MKKIIAFLMLTVMVCGFLCACNIVKSPDKYEVGGDKITSITKVVGDRKVKSVKTQNQLVKYIYKQVSDTAGDVEKYVEYLVSNEGFDANVRYNNLDTAGDITLTKPSPSDSSCTLKVRITWDDSEYTVVAEREKSLE